MEIEYRIEEVIPANLKKTLDELGKDGWDLASTVPPVNGFWHLIFKRQVDDSRDLRTALRQRPVGR